MSSNSPWSAFRALVYSSGFTHLFIQSFIKEFIYCTGVTWHILPGSHCADHLEYTVKFPLFGELKLDGGSGGGRTDHKSTPVNAELQSECFKGTEHHSVSSHNNGT